MPDDTAPASEPQTTEQKRLEWDAADVYHYLGESADKHILKFSDLSVGSEFAFVTPSSPGFGKYTARGRFRKVGEWRACYMHDASWFLEIERPGSGYFGLKPDNRVILLDALPTLEASDAN